MYRGEPRGNSRDEYRRGWMHSANASTATGVTGERRRGWRMPQRRGSFSFSGHDSFVGAGARSREFCARKTGVRLRSRVLARGAGFRPVTRRVVMQQAALLE